jgi:sugar phosphate permease
MRGTHTNRSLPFHYGWVVIFAGAIATFAALGLGRFALGMLLPSMGESIPLSYDEMGFISTANFVGYLTAVLLSAFATERLGARGLIFVGLMMCALSMMMVSFANGFLTIAALYFITGMGSGAVNVPVMALVSHWFGRSLRGRAAGFIVMGSGFAIMFSGIVIPQINLAYGAEGWRTSWLLLGAISVVIALVAGFLQRNNPSDMGLHAIGEAAAVAAATATPATADNQSHRRTILTLGMIYFAFGSSYVIYATFIVTTLVDERGFTEAAAGQFWFWVGLLSLASGPLFGALSDKLGRKAGLIIVFSMQMCAYLLVAFDLPTPFLYLSVCLFGLVAWSVPTIMAAATGDYMGPQRAAAAFGMITLFFGAGQIVGPGGAGLLAEQLGGFSISYFLAATVVALAIGLTLTLRRPE